MATERTFQQQLDDVIRRLERINTTLEASRTGEPAPQPRSAGKAERSAV
jgi:hypothetical protein